MARKIVVAIHKGGVGKTTTAKNVAAALAMRGKRTLLVDVDEQANATKGLGVDPAALPATINDLFADPDRDPSSVLLLTPVEGMHLMPAHADLAKTETGMGLQRADPTAPDPIVALRLMLRPLEDHYDFIVFDTPPALNYMTVNALAAADEVLIPAAASAYTEGGVTTTWEAYERAKSSYNPALARARILITRVKHTNASGVVSDALNSSYAAYVLPHMIVESTSVDEAEQLGQPEKTLWRRMTRCRTRTRGVLKHALNNNLVLCQCELHHFSQAGYKLWFDLFVRPVGYNPCVTNYEFSPRPTARPA